MKKLVFGLIAIVLFSCSSTAQTENLKGGAEGFSGHSVKGFLLLAENGCYTILVNIYENIGGVSTIISSTTVCVGNCGKFSPTHKNSTCEDFELNGDWFYSSKYNFDICASDLLKDSKTYENYLEEKRIVIESIKE